MKLNAHFQLAVAVFGRQSQLAVGSWQYSEAVEIKKPPINLNIGGF